MEQSKYLTALKESIVNMDFDAVTRVAQEAMAAGIEPQLAIAEGMVPGMSIVGDKFASGEYFLSELVVAGEVMREGLKVINPYLKGSSSSGSAGKVILATVEGDLHNLGKNIVATLLTVHGFEVIDLGVDVPTQRIVDAVREQRPVALGLSALLTVTLLKMGEVIQALRAADIKDSVKVIIGGAATTPEFSQSIGADHRAANAQEGVQKCLEWAADEVR